MADEEDVLLNGKSLSSYRVVDLKKECDKRGLSKSGSKFQLVERMKAQLLLEQLQSQPISDSDEAPNIKMKEDEKTGKSEFIKQYLERQQKILVVEREARKRFSEEESESSQDEKTVESPKKPKESPTKVDRNSKEEPDSQPPVDKQIESNSAEVMQVSDDTSGGERPARKMKRLSQEETVNENVEEMKPPRKTRRWRKDVPESKEADNTVDTVEEDVSSKQLKTRRSSTQDEEEDPVRERTRRTSSQDSDETTRVRRSSQQSMEEDVPINNETDNTAESREKAENIAIKAETIKLEPHSKSQPSTHRPSVTASDEPIVNDKKSATLAAVIKDEPPSDQESAPDPVAGKDKHLSSDKEMMTVVKDEPLASDKEIKRKGDEISNTKMAVSSVRRNTPEPMEKDSPGDERRSRKQRKSRSSSSSSSSSSRFRSRSRSSSTSRSRSPQKRTRRRSRSSSSSSRSRSRSPIANSRSERPKSNSRSRSRTPIKNGKRTTSSPSPSKSPVGSKSPSRSRSPTPEKTRHAAKSLDEHGSKHQSEEKEDKNKAKDKRVQRKNSVEAEENSSVAGTQNAPEKEIDSDRTPDTSSSLRVAAVGPRKVSLSGRDKEEDKGDDDGKEKPVRKRKWGSSRRPSATTQPIKHVSSINISTDSLKGLIPEIKLTEPVLNLDHEDEKISDQEEDKRDVIKLRRTVVMKDDEEREHEKLDDAVNEKEEDVEMVDANSDDEVENKPPTPKKEPTIVRRVSQQTSLEADEPMAAPRSPSPARNPPSSIVHIRNLVRPFTLNQLKELVGRTGTMVDSEFWIDKIKSHCFVTYETEQQAVDTRKALHGTKWPSSNPKVLKVEYATADDISHYRDKELGPKGVKRQIQQDVKPKQPEGEKREKERETRKKEEQKPPPPIREWDRDKLRQSRERDRERSPRDRNRSRSGPDDRRQRDRSRERDRERKDRRVPGTEKAEDEPPAKLLDDLFKKTKATPCIYWLPLTEAQYIQKEKERKERQVARERIRQEDEPSSQDRAGQNRRKSPPPRSSPVKRRGDSRDRGAQRRPERGGRGGRSNSPGYGRRRR